jgi:hypothetical protein
MLPLRNNIWTLEIVTQITYTAQIRETEMGSTCIFDGASNKRDKKETKAEDRRK